MLKKGQEVHTKKCNFLMGNLKNMNAFQDHYFINNGKEHSQTG